MAPEHERQAASALSAVSADGGQLAYPGERELFLAPLPEGVSANPVLAALRLRRGPSARDLIERLQQLRDGSPTDVDGQDVDRVYRLLGYACPTMEGRVQLVDDLTVAELRAAFAGRRGARGLIFLRGEWYSPAQVYTGPAIFGRRRPFVPQSAPLDRLWRVLDVRPPDVADCLAVLRELSMKPLENDERVIVLESMRLIAGRIETLSPQVRGQLRRLPLWTGSGWVTTRPVYAVEDETLADKVADKVPVWKVAFSSFAGMTALLTALGVVLLRGEDFSSESEDGGL